MDTMPGVVEVVLVAALTILVVLASAAALFGYGMFRPLARLPAVENGRKVSIIVAAKNEADTLRECLASVTALDYRDKEVIVVCGPSEDGTEEIAQEFRTKLTVLREPERPADWVGKSWACREGYLKSTGEILLFTDGDLVHSHESLGVVLANLESTKADLFSVWPQIATRSPSERVVLPASIFFLCAGVASVASTTTPTGRKIEGANGQYIMITRKAYDSIGGHEAIKTDIMEDGAMGRRSLSHGLEVVNANGQGYLRVMPYSRFGEVWEAHERFGAGLIPSWEKLLGAVVLILAYFVGPFALLAAALLTRDWSLAIAAGCICTLVYATQVFFSFKTSKLQYFLLAPLSGLLLTAAFVTGFARFRRGGITWKAVKYAIDRFKPL